jgi:hypothetical protein
MTTSWFDFLKTAVFHSVLTIGLWTIGSAVVGSIAGFLVHLGLGRMGAWRLGWPHVKWWRVLTCIWLVLLFGFLSAIGGGLEGTRRAVRYLVESEPVRRVLLLPLGRLGAVTMAYAHCRMDGSRAEAAAFVRDFRDGKSEIPVQAFLIRMHGLADTEAEALSNRTQSFVESRLELAPTHWIGRSLKRTTGTVYRWLFRRILEDNVVGIGTSNGLEHFLDTLPESGASGGNPATLSFEEAAWHIVDHGFIPMIRVWLDGWIIMEQLLLGVGLLFFALLPVALFWILRLIEKPSKQTTDH